MTSGNVSEEPIAYRDDEALDGWARSPTCSFSTIVRSTCAPTIPSCARSTRRGAPRRCCCGARAASCRGAWTWPSRRRGRLLGCGAELKNTFCLAKGARAWVGHHIGDLKNYETLSSFAEGIEHFERLFAVEPEIVAHDLHPDYLSTRYALEREGVELGRRPASSRPPGGLCSRSTARTARRSARSTTAPATGPTARCGVASC